MWSTPYQSYTGNSRHRTSFDKNLRPSKRSGRSAQHVARMARRSVLLPRRAPYLSGESFPLTSSMVRLLCCPSGRSEHLSPQGRNTVQPQSASAKTQTATNPVSRSSRLFNNPGASSNSKMHAVNPRATPKPTQAGRRRRWA